METEINETFDLSGLQDEQIYEAVKKLTGVIEQTPPIYFAVKVDGKRAYKSAREGEEIVIKSKQVEVREFEITNIKLPELEFRIVCSKGTYIRSLANDLGKLLGVGAYLSSLCRTRIGTYELKDSMDYEGFREWVNGQTTESNSF